MGLWGISKLIKFCNNLQSIRTGLELDDGTGDFIESPISAFAIWTLTSVSMDICGKRDLGLNSIFDFGLRLPNNTPQPQEIAERNHFAIRHNTYPLDFTFSWWLIKGSNISYESKNSYGLILFSWSPVVILTPTCPNVTFLSVLDKVTTLRDFNNADWYFIDVQSSLIFTES